MLKIIVIVIVLAVVGLLVYAAMQPEDFRIERSTTVKAPPERIYPLIADLRAWGPWSPWEKKDPAMKRTFSGPDSGVGAAYAWEGDKNVGTGKMTILEATAPGKVVIKLEFLKPFEATNTAEFTLKPQGDSTAIHWAMYGKNNFLVQARLRLHGHGEDGGAGLRVGARGTEGPGGEAGFVRLP